MQQKAVKTPQGLFLSRGQKYAALALAIGLILLLAAVIVSVILVGRGFLRPTPQTADEKLYLEAKQDETDAVRAAEAASREPDSDEAVVQARSQLILLALKTDENPSALTRRARKLVEQAPQNAFARYAYAAALAHADEPTAALTAYKRAAATVDEGEPDLERMILTDYSKALRAAGQDVAAYKTLQDAAAVPPASSDLYIQLAHYAEEQNKWDEAAIAYVQALRYDPENIQAQEGIARLQTSGHADAVDTAQKQQESADD